MIKSTNGVWTRLKSIRVLALLAVMCSVGLIVLITINHQGVSEEDIPAGAAPQETVSQNAQTEIDSTAIVAKIGDMDITELDLMIATNALGRNVQNIPSDQRRAVIFRSLVETKLMAQAAREAGLDQGDEFKAQVVFLTDDTLRSAYVKNQIVNSITSEEIEQAIDTRIEELSSEENIRARHILVQTEEEAKALVVELEGGKDFAELAAEKSTGPSGPRGGDLGFFGRGQMVPAFEQAAFALKIGEISAPIQSNFGWHVIKLEERRAAPVPQRVQLENEVRQSLLVEKYRQTFDNLISKVQVDIVDPTIDSQILSAPQ